MWIDEAKFGFSCINEYCKNISTNGKVLEIGCGSGILLSMISQNFDGLMIEGIEPFGSVFSPLSELNKVVKDSDISIKHVGYEQFNPKKKYDLIYCVNVFEHVDSWRKFLVTVSKWLNNDGKIVILSPNYGFPYESHFGIPVIVNKSLTFSLFKKFIVKYEKDSGIKGLWDTLNFVKKREVVDFIKSKPSLILLDDISIIDFMIKRIAYDESFKKRHKLMRLIALVVQKIGLLKILKLFPMIIPYMKFEIHQKV